MKTNPAPSLALALIAATWLTSIPMSPVQAAGAAKAAPMPDFTKGSKLAKDAPHDWTLGPTGARGWIFTANGHSRDARQILVTEVAKGSPADGVLGVGDVILGVDGKNFSGDARVSFAKTIAAAESEKGALRLLRWRGGKSEAVELKLAVLGSYSATAPYACEKSKRIFELGCASLAKRMADEKTYTRRLDGIPRALNGLALLASGNKEYLPLVKREAQWAANFSTRWLQRPGTTATSLMLLSASTSSATGDEIRSAGFAAGWPWRQRTAKARVGSWGHKFAHARRAI